jgi:hypothetical protein
MLQWFEILQIAQTLHLSSESDTLVWKFEPNGVFSVKSMYAIINFRGIIHVHVYSIWKLNFPQKFISSYDWLFTTKISLEII